MSGAIAAVSGVSATVGPSSLSQLTGASPSKTAENEFSTALSGAMQNLQDTQTRAGDLSVKAVTGQLDDVHDYTIAATEAAVTLEVTAAVRNRMVEAFTEIMRMQA